MMYSKLQKTTQNNYVFVLLNYNWLINYNPYKIWSRESGSIILTKSIFNLAKGIQICPEDNMKKFLIQCAKKAEGYKDYTQESLIAKIDKEYDNNAQWTEIDQKVNIILNFIRMMLQNLIVSVV